MVEGNSSYDDHTVALGAGYVEGVLTGSYTQYIPNLGFMFILGSAAG